MQGFGLLILVFCIQMIVSVCLSIKIIFGMAELIIRGALGMVGACWYVVNRIPLNPFTCAVLVILDIYWLVDPDTNYHTADSSGFSLIQAHHNWIRLFSSGIRNRERQ